MNHVILGLFAYMFVLLIRLTSGMSHLILGLFAYMFVLLFRLTSGMNHLILGLFAYMFVLLFRSTSGSLSEQITITVLNALTRTHCLPNRQLLDKLGHHLSHCIKQY